MAKQNKGRKFVAATATAALVASAIVPVASAAVNDFNKVAPYAQDAVQYLVDNGVVQGDEKGNFDPKGTITRAQAATIFANYFELEAGEENPFTDVKAGAWYTDAITAAYAAGLVNGLDETTFGPSKTLTRAEAATLLVRAFELEGAADLSDFADAKGLASWKTDALAVAVEYGVITGKEKNGKLYLDADAPITRQEFATIFHRTLDATGVIDGGEETPATKDTAIVSLTATAVNELTVKFNQAVDTEKAVFAVAKGSTTYKVSDVDWNEAGTEAVIEVDTKFVEGTYNLTVTGVAEKALTASVKTTKEVPTSIKFLSNALTLTGNKRTSDDTVEAKITFEVYNQYGEDITNTISIGKYKKVDLKGIKDESITVSAKGVITAWIDADEDEGDKGTLTLEYEDKPNDIYIEASQEVVLSEESEPGLVSNLEIYNDSELAFTTQNVEAGEDFYITFTVKDQYGVEINAKDARSNTSADSALLEAVKDGLRLSVTNNDIFDADEDNIEIITVKGKPTFAVKLEFDFDKLGLVEEAGKNTVTFKSKATGDEVSKEFTLEESVLAYQVDLLEPDEAIADGETVKLAATVLDQFGNEIKNAAALNRQKNTGLINIDIDLEGRDVTGEYFEVVDGKLYLTFDLPRLGNIKVDDPAELEIEVEVEKGKDTELTLAVEAEAYATTLVGLKDSVVTSIYANGGTLSLSNSSFVIQDQYGRTYNKAVTINIKDDSGKVDATTTATGFRVASNDRATGSGTVTFELVTPNGEENSELTVSFRTVNETSFASYEVSTGTTYAGTTEDTIGTDYQLGVAAYGVLTNGKKVRLPKTAYAIRAKDAFIETTTSGDSANVSNAAVNYLVTTLNNSKADQVNAKFEVVINQTGHVIASEVTLSEAKPTGASFVAKDKATKTEVAKVEVTATGTAINVADIFDALEDVANLIIEDQYGVEAVEIDGTSGTLVVTYADVAETTETAKLTISDINDADNKFQVNSNGQVGANIAGVNTGDSFNATFTVGGASKTVKVIVK